jgi:hypothetical protein
MSYGLADQPLADGKDQAEEGDRYDHLDQGEAGRRTKGAGYLRVNKPN